MLSAGGRVGSDFLDLLVVGLVAIRLFHLSNLVDIFAKGVYFSVVELLEVELSPNKLVLLLLLELLLLKLPLPLLFALKGVGILNVR